MGIRERTLAAVRNRAADVNQQIVRDLRHASARIQGRVLDLGCGSKPYRNLFSNATWYVGLDLPAGRSANRHTKNADVYGSLCELPFRAASFDAVISTQALEHVAEPENALNEAARVLKGGGMLLLTIPFMAAEHEEPHDYLRFTTFGIQAMLSRAGFETLEVRKQFTFWSAIGEMIYWHFHRKVSGRRWEKYWYAFGTTIFLRAFHLLNRLDRDDKLALNLCVVAQKLRQAATIEPRCRIPLRK